MTHRSEISFFFFAVNYIMEMFFCPDTMKGECGDGCLGGEGGHERLMVNRIMKIDARKESGRNLIYLTAQHHNLRQLNRIGANRIEDILEFIDDRD